MTFESLHESAESSQPVVLYEIRMEATRWYYTSAEIDISAGSTYESSQIAHSDIQNSGEQAKNELTLTIPHNLPVAEYLASYIPAHEIYLTISLYERGLSPYVLNHAWSGVFISGSLNYPKFSYRFLRLITN